MEADGRLGLRTGKAERADEWLTTSTSAACEWRASSTISSTTRRCRGPASRRKNSGPASTRIVHDLAPQESRTSGEARPAAGGDRRLAPRAAATRHFDLGEYKAFLQRDRLPAAGRPGLRGLDRERRSGDRRDRRAAAGRAGDECALCAERRQRPLGQPLRRALRHRRDPRGRRGGARQGLQSRCAGRAVIAFARGVLDEAAPLDGGSLEGRDGASRSTGGSSSVDACETATTGLARCRHSSPAIAATRGRALGGPAAEPRPAPRDPHRPQPPDRRERPGRHRRRRRRSGDDHDHGLRGFDRRRRRRGQGRWPTATGSA